jgi:hypothetical protein
MKVQEIGSHLYDFVGGGDVLNLLKKPRKVTLYLAHRHTGRDRAEG